MAWIATATIGSALIGGAISSSNSSKAAKAQVQSADQASQTQRDIFAQQTALQEPFRQAGLRGQNRLMDLLGISDNMGQADYGKYARDFSMADYQVDPGYQFRLSEGMKGLERSAAARGGLLSGSMLKNASRFNQDQASNEFMNAFNRYQTNRSNQINPLQAFAGQGQSATNVLSNDAGNMGRVISENQLGAGNARATNYANQAGAFNTALSTGTNALTDWLGRSSATVKAPYGPTTY